MVARVRRARTAVVTTVAAALALGAEACQRREAHADLGARTDRTTARAARTIATVDVPSDARVWVVPGNPAAPGPIVYLHGMCADPRDGLDAWGGLAEEHGTVIALPGDTPCPDRPGRAKWTTDAADLHRRIGAAIEAVRASAARRLSADDLVLVGASMGAARAESLAKRFPERYARVVLVGSPRVPSPDSFRGAKAVASLAGEKESSSMMREGVRVLEGAGTRARFWLLPGAAHGQYGPDGERVMREAVGFVRDAP